MAVRGTLVGVFEGDHSAEQMDAPRSYVDPGLGPVHVAISPGRGADSSGAPTRTFN